jgi:hypothetical protein
MRVLLLAVLAVTPNCKKNHPADTQTSAHATPLAMTQTDTGAAASSPADVAEIPGPRQEVSGEHCALVASLLPPSSTPGQTTLEVKLEARDGFHINELDEVQLQLEASNATVRSALSRTDATESTQDGVKFVVPVQVTGASPVVRGRLRFSVCASICIRQRLSFAVAVQ